MGCVCIAVFEGEDKQARVAKPALVCFEALFYKQHFLRLNHLGYLETKQINARTHYHF